MSTSATRRDEITIITVEIAAIVGKVLGKEVKYEYVPIEKFAELRFAGSNQPRQNTSASFYSDPGAFSPDSGKSFVMQHLTEVANRRDFRLR